MGSNSGVAGVMLLVLFFPLTLSAQTLPVLQPAPVSPVHAANDPYFAKTFQAANDTHFRVNVATEAAKQSGLGKIMSRIFSKRALAAGLRGTPQAMAVGLALDATLSYFLSEEGASPDAVVNQGLNESLHSRTWGELALNKGLLNTSDLTVKLQGNNEKTGFTNIVEFERSNDSFYLKMPDGVSVHTKSGGVVRFDFAPFKPLLVIIPDKVEPFTFTPSPVYDFRSFSCSNRVYFPTVHGYAFSSKHKFAGHTSDTNVFSDDLSALAACLFKLENASSEDMISFSVASYSSKEPIVFGYPEKPEVKISYTHYVKKYNPQSDEYEKHPSNNSLVLKYIHLSSDYASFIYPRIFSDYADQIDPNKIQEPLAPSLAANMINNSLMHGASRADYQGIPFSTSTPVTVEEIQQAANETAVPLTKGMLYQQINYFPPPASHPSVNSDVRPFPSEDPDFFPQTDHGFEPYVQPVSSAQQIDTAHPGIGSPSLEDPPDGKHILAPLLTLFPFIKNFTLPVRNVACPVAEFDVFERYTVMSSHCELLEKNRALFALLAGIIWAFLSLRVVLSA